jgi:type II secretory pathway component PulF
MPLYRYRAVDQKGRKYKDSIEKESLSEAASFLEKLGMAPLSLKPARAKAAPSPYSDVEMRDMCRGLGSIMETEPSPLRAFRALEQWRGMGRVCAGVFPALERGAGLSGAFLSNLRFPKAIGVACRIGEEKGRLPHALHMLADFFELEANMRKIADEAFLMRLVPALASAALVPAAMGFGGAAFNAGSIFPVVFVALAAFIPRALKSVDSPLMSFIRARAPFFGRARALGMSRRLCLLLEKSKAAGFNTHEALEVLAAAAKDKLLKEALGRVARAVGLGREAWALLEGSSFDMATMARLRSGEDKGELAEVAKALAEELERRHTALLERSVVACCAAAGSAAVAVSVLAAAGVFMR